MVPRSEAGRAMVFNSFHFAVFFLVVYLLYRSVAHRQQNWLLLLASYYFYGSWDWRFLALLLASTGVDYVCAIYIDSRPDPRRRKTALIVSLGFNLSMLGFFKYFNFFADSLETMLHAAGLQADFATLHIVLPIGISFYTFITMSYVIDVYRRDITPCRNLRDFALFVAYFPHLVAGPILRAGWLLPQIVKPRAIRADQIRDGLWLILWGFFKKVFVADNLAHVADAVFNQQGHVAGAEVVLGVYAFAFQIYGDFSGYSDIARGTSLLMGIELNVNFRFPYFVRSATDFWRHWHISLSTWLRDYLYIPLGGSRHGSASTKRNLALTMILGGLWHGAAWTYVLWGAYQGALLMAFRTGQEWLARRPQMWLDSAWARALGILVMFHLTCYGWLIFRAHSFGQIVGMSASLGGAYDFASPRSASYALQLGFFAGPLLVMHAYEAWRDDLMVVFTLPVAVCVAVCAVLFYMTVLWGEFGGPEFIYFRF
jgi:D-alanyl-lipoteichoic acid acyltransferase DltB (MBOAT superfamily)